MDVDNKSVINKIKEIKSKLTSAEIEKILDLGFSNYYYNITGCFEVNHRYNESKDNLFWDCYGYCDVDSKVMYYNDISYKTDFIETFRLIHGLNKKLGIEGLIFIEDCMVKRDYREDFIEIMSN